MGFLIFIRNFGVHPKVLTFEKAQDFLGFLLTYSYLCTHYDKKEETITAP